MAKLKLDGTSPSPSPYADWTSNYRTSQMIEDRRDYTKSEQPSSTPRGIASQMTSTTRAANRSPSTASELTPDDYQTTDIGAAQFGKATPGSGFPSVTSNQQKANYAPQMEEYISNSKKK